MRIVVRAPMSPSEMPKGTEQPTAIKRTVSLLLSLGMESGAVRCLLLLAPACPRVPGTRDRNLVKTAQPYSSAKLSAPDFVTGCGHPDFCLQALPAVQEQGPKAGFLSPRLLSRGLRVLSAGH
ncbi:hypothetical protein CapIbe_007572 [Capra ibex]